MHVQYQEKSLRHLEIIGHMYLAGITRLDHLHYCFVTLELKEGSPSSSRAEILKRCPRHVDQKVSLCRVMLLFLIDLL